MYGAVIGDIVGSPFEFDRSPKVKNFGPLFTEESFFTDDSVMTFAVAEALLSSEKKDSDRTIMQNLVRCMQRWGREYPNAGYGGRFVHWLWSQNPEPYGSFGNGSAMRVSAAGWLYDSMQRTREIAQLTALVSHNHPEGIKGAESVAAAIYMARNGFSKEEIKKYIIKEFDYDFSRTLDEIRPSYRHVESCQETVPEAFTAFFEGEDFEDVIRNAVSLGGDCDTLTCIAGAIGDAYFGVPQWILDECLKKLDLEMRKLLLEVRG